MIDLRRLLRPFPRFLVFLFVAVAIVDLVHSLRETPEQPPVLLRRGMIQFEELNPVIDFRPWPPDPEVEYRPELRLTGRKWSAPERRGVWMTADGAALELAVAEGGHRVMILDCRPAGGSQQIRDLVVTINDRGCGSVDLTKGWGRYRVDLPANALRAGNNRIVFGLPDVKGAPTLRPHLLMRRLGFFFDEGVRDRAILRKRPMSVDIAEGAVSFFASGTLEVPFSVDDRIDALRLKYRFRNAGGRAEVVVGRPQGEGVGRDADFQRSITVDRRRGGRVRIPLHGRRGDFVLKIRVDLNPRPAGLDFTSLQLVKENRSADRPRRRQARPAE
jgi:hypothetical protein